MKWIKYTAIALFTCFALFVLAMHFMFSGERPESEFDSYSEAKASGLMDRGWIPTFIPKSARNIKEQHDLDSNWVEMTFEYNPEDITFTRDACDSERSFEGGIELTCKYFSSNVSIKLYGNGQAELYSSPN